MAAADADLRALVARVTRAVTEKSGRRRDDLAGLVAAEVARALESAEGAGGASSPAPRNGTTSGAASERPVPRSELCASCLEQERRRSGHRAVVTTSGKNQRGIVAKIAQAIADAGGDILDISQTLVADYFTMIIVVDMTGLAEPFAAFKTRLTQAVQSLGAECLVMHEEVVSALQRI
jgi:ACT domain-containing protein